MSIEEIVSAQGTDLEAKYRSATKPVLYQASVDKKYSYPTLKNLNSAYKIGNIITPEHLKWLKSQAIDDDYFNRDVSFSAEPQDGGFGLAPGNILIRDRQGGANSAFTLGYEPVYDNSGAPKVWVDVPRDTSGFEWDLGLPPQKMQIPDPNYKGPLVGYKMVQSMKSDADRYERDYMKQKEANQKDDMMGTLIKGGLGAAWTAVLGGQFFGKEGLFSDFLKSVGIDPTATLASQTDPTGLFSEYAQEIAKQVADGSLSADAANSAFEALKTGTSGIDPTQLNLDNLLKNIQADPYDWTKIKSTTAGQDYIDTLIKESGLPIDPETGLLTGTGTVTDATAGAGGGVTSSGDTSVVPGGGGGGSGGGTTTTGGGTTAAGGSGATTGITGTATTATPGILTQLATSLGLSEGDLTKLLGGATGLLGNYLSGDKAIEAQKEYSDSLERIAKMNQFRPVGVTTRFGSSNFKIDPVTGQVTEAGYTLDPALKAIQDRQMGMLGGLQKQYEDVTALGKGYLATSPQEQAKKYYDEQQAIMGAGRERELAALQNKLLQQGRLGLATGGTTTGMMAANPEMEALFNARRQQDLELAGKATQGGMDYARFGMDIQNKAYQPLQTALGGAGYIEGLGQQPMDMGINIGAKGQNANQGSMNLLAQSAQAMKQGDAYSPFGSALSGAGGMLSQYGQQQQQQSAFRYDPYTGIRII